MPTAGCFWSFPRLLGAPLSTTRFKVWFSITSSTLWNWPSFTVSTLGRREGESPSVSRMPSTALLWAADLTGIAFCFTFYLQITLNLHKLQKYKQYGEYLSQLWIPLLAPCAILRLSLSPNTHKCVQTHSSTHTGFLNYLKVRHTHRGPLSRLIP